MLQFPAYLDENPIEPPVAFTEPGPDLVIATTVPVEPSKSDNHTLPTTDEPRSDSPGAYSNTHTFSDVTSPLKDPVMMGVRAPMISPTNATVTATPPGPVIRTVTASSPPEQHSPNHVSFATTPPPAATPSRPLGPLPPIQGRGGALPPLAINRSPTLVPSNTVTRPQFPISGVTSPTGTSPKQASISANAISTNISSSSNHYNGLVSGGALPRRLEAQTSQMGDPGAAELTLADITNGPINFDDSGNGNPYNRDARTEIPPSGPDRGQLDEYDDHGHLPAVNIHSYGNTLGRTNLSPAEQNPLPLFPSAMDDRPSLLRIQPSTSPVLSRSAQPAGASVTLIGSSHSDAGDGDEDPFDQLEQEWQGVTAAAIFAFTDPPSITVESLRIVLLSTGQLIALGATLLASNFSKSQRLAGANSLGGNGPNAANGSAGTHSAATTGVASINNQLPPPISNRNPFRAPSVHDQPPNTSISDNERSMPHMGGAARTGSGGRLNSLAIGGGNGAPHELHATPQLQAITQDLKSSSAIASHAMIPVALIVQYLRLVGMNLTRYRSLPESPLAKRLAEFTLKDFEDASPAFLAAMALGTMSSSGNNGTPPSAGMRVAGASSTTTPTTVGGRRQKKKITDLLESMLETVTNTRDREYDDGVLSFYHRSWTTSRPSPSELPYDAEDEAFDDQLTTALNSSAGVGPLLSFPRQCVNAALQLACIIAMLVIAGVYAAIPELIILIVALLLHLLALAALLSRYRLSLIYYLASGTSLVVAGGATIANTYAEDRGRDDGDYDTKLPLAGVMCAMLVVVYLLGTRAVEVFSELDAVRLSPAMAFESVWTSRLVTLPTLITVVVMWHLIAIASCILCWVGHGATKTDLNVMSMSDIIILFGTVGVIALFVVNSVLNCYTANGQVRSIFAAGTIRIRFLESMWSDLCQQKISGAEPDIQGIISNDENPLETNVSPHAPVISEEPETTSTGPPEGRREGVFGSVSPAAFAQQYNVTASGNTKSIQLAGRDLSIDGEVLFYAYDTDNKPSDSYSSGNVIGVPEKPSGQRVAPVIIRSMLQDVHFYTAMVCVNAQGNVTFWNKRMELLTGFKQIDVVGSSIHSFVLGGDQQQKKLQEAISNTMKDVNQETRIKVTFSNTKRMQQALIALELSSFPAKTTQGHTVGVLFVGNSDATEILKEVADELFAIQSQRQKIANNGISATPSMVGGESGTALPTSPTDTEQPQPAQLMSPLIQSVSTSEDASLTKLSHIFARLNDAIDMMSLSAGTSDAEPPTLVSIPVLVGRIVSTRLASRKVNVKIAPNMLPANLNDERLSFVLMETLQHYTERNNGVTLSIGYDVKRSGAIAFNFQPQRPFGQWAPSPHSTACLEKLRAMVRAGHKGAVTLIFLSTVTTQGIPLNGSEDAEQAIHNEMESDEAAKLPPVDTSIRCNIALMDSNPVTNTLIRTQSWNRKHLLYFIDDMESLESSLDSVDVLFVRFPRDQFPEDIDHLLRRLIVSKTYLYIILIEPLVGNPNMRIAYGDRISVLNQPVTLVVLQTAFYGATDFVAKKRQKERKALEAKELFTTAKSAPWQRGALLGQGSFATVYEATNMVTKGRMAVRIVKIDRTGDSETINKLVRDTIAEIKLMASLEHKNIISYLYCEKDVDTINVFMEYAERGSLMSVLKKGPVAVETAAGWVRDILSGLDYLHGQGFVHLDLKAANVLLTGDGTCKLADFGTSRQMLTVTGRRNSAGGGDEPAGGTLHFMAPEVLAGESPTWRADIWSLGCVVIELLTGKPPHAHIANPLAVARYVSLLTPDSIPIIPSSITNTDAIKFIEACLRVDQEQRPSAQTLMVHPFILENAVKENALKQPKPLAVGRRLTTKHTTSMSEDSERRESCFSLWGGGKPM